jgi:hypothetical protein
MLWDRQSKFLTPNEPDLCDREGPLAREPCPLTEKAHLQENLLLGDPKFAFLTLVLLQRSIEYIDLYTVIVFKRLSRRSLQPSDRLHNYIFS